MFSLKDSSLLAFDDRQQNLATVLMLLMFLAFLVDQVQQDCCPLFQGRRIKNWFYCSLLAIPFSRLSRILSMNSLFEDGFFVHGGFRCW